MNTLQDLLEQFRGKSTAEIAAMVKSRGIKGRQGTTYGCPMALLLGGMSTGSYVIGRKYVVRVSGKEITKSRTPKNVADFARKFDIGGYPDMVSPPPRCLAPRGKRPGNRHKVKTGGRTRPPIKNHLAKLVGRFTE